MLIPLIQRASAAAHNLDLRVRTKHWMHVYQETVAPDRLAALKKVLPANPMVIPKAKVDEIKAKLNLSTEELLQQLAVVAKDYARPPLSHFNIGEAGIGTSGSIYMGVNLEFRNFPPSQVVHGEQFMVVNALMHGEKGLDFLELPTAACGHCRQFLNEIGTSNSTKMTWPGNKTVSIRTLLPNDFGPEVRGVKGGMMTQKKRSLELKHKLNAPADTVQTALDAADVSYSPYRNAPSGVALRTKDGKNYGGPYLENVAANPSLPPLQAALVMLVADGKSYADITDCVLIEKEDAPISHAIFSRALVKSIAPNAHFHLGHTKSEPPAAPAQPNQTSSNTPAGSRRFLGVIEKAFHGFERHTN